MCECPIHFTRYSSGTCVGSVWSGSPNAAVLARAPRITSTCFPDSKIWSTTPLPFAEAYATFTPSFKAPARLFG